MAWPKGKPRNSHRGTSRRNRETVPDGCCVETIKHEKLYGCKARNDGRWFPDPCPKDGNYGCKYTGLKKRHVVKTEVE